MKNTRFAPLGVVRAAMSAVCLSIVLCASAASDIVINEVCYKNSKNSDGNGSDSSDWIELYNRGKSPCNIKGLTIGKKKSYDKSIEKASNFYTFTEDYELDPGEFLVVYMDKDLPAAVTFVDTEVNGRIKKVPWIRFNKFNLGTEVDEDSGIEYQDNVRLFDVDEDHKELSEYKDVLPLDKNTSIGYLWDGNRDAAGVKPDVGKIVFAKPTPWNPNASKIAMPVPEFGGDARCPGVYASKQTVTVSVAQSAEPGRTNLVYYTLDGSDPRTSKTRILCKGTVTLDARADAKASSGLNATNAWIRTSPVELAAREPGAAWAAPIGTVPRATPLRACSVWGPAVSALAEGTWFIGPAFAERELPIVSVLAGEKNLYSDELGILVPGRPYLENGYGANKWGKPNANYFDDNLVSAAHWELLEPGATRPALAFGAGLALHGGGTRSLPEKTLYAHLKKDYDEYAKSIEYALVPGLGKRVFKRFLLRNDGNDWYGPGDSEGVSTMMKDLVFHRIAAELRIGTMQGRPAAVYLNGDYHGILNIREAVDKHYFATRYGLDADNIDILSHEDASDSNVKISRVDGDKKADDEYEEMLVHLDGVDPKSAAGYKEFTDRIDVDNYIDYIAAETFFANTDWPINNCDFWRAHTNETGNAYGDGRWRWVLYDLDLAGLKVDGEGGVDRNMFKYLSSDRMTATNEPAFLFNKLMKNASFKAKFIARYEELLDTAFHPDRTSAIIAEAAGAVEGEIERHYRRWGRPYSAEDWAGAVESTLVDFTARRWANSYRHLNAKYDLGGVAALDVALAPGDRGGRISVDDVDRGVEWRARRIGAVSVKLEAVPAEGHVFDRWSDGVKTAVRVVNVAQGAEVTLVPEFRLDTADIIPWPADADGAYDPLVANVYNGYLIDEDGEAAGIVEVKAAKGAKKTTRLADKSVKTWTNVTVTAAVKDRAGKKWSYSKGAGNPADAPGAALSVTGLVSTAKGVPVPTFEVELGANGLRGNWGEFEIRGARNGMNVKGDPMKDALENLYRKSWSFTLDDGTCLQFTVGAKGAVKVSGLTGDGFKVSSSAQAVMGTDGLCLLVPVSTTLKNGKLERDLHGVFAFLEDGTAALVDSPLFAIAAGPTEAPVFVDPIAAETIPAGVAYSRVFAIRELGYPAKFSATKQPTGLKINATTGEMAGVPSKAGEFAAEVKATSAVDSKKTAVAPVAWTVSAMPGFSYGTYSGFTAAGTVTLTVAAGTGKISGKIVENGTNWTISAASYSALEDGRYRASLVGKSGKRAFTNETAFVEERVVAGGPEKGGFFTAPSAEWHAFEAPQNLWKQEPWKSVAKTLAADPEFKRGKEFRFDAEGALRPELEHPYATLVVKLSASGDATIAAKFVTGVNAKGKDVIYSASSKAPLVPEGPGTFVVNAFVPAKAGRFPGFFTSFAIAPAPID